MSTDTGKSRIKVPSNEISFEEISRTDRETVLGALRRGATRREVMGWLMAMGATVATAGSIVTAAGKALAQTPKRGGSLRCAMALHGPSDTLDPQLVTSAIDYVRGRATYNNLVQLDDNIVPPPELAEEFSPSDNAREWTFKLRRDVEFHDGSKLTADDVVWTMNRHIGENSVSKAKALVSTVKEWKKLDDYTVRAILDSPNADLPAALGTFHFRILKRETTDFSAPPGTGPFKIKEFKQGVRSVHERNDNYWRSGGPNLDELEIFGITDSVARVNALLAGDINMMSQLDPKAIKQVEAAPGFEVLSVPSGAYMSIVCMRDKSPGKNHDFVEAMKYLQRRERIVKSILKGHGTVGNDHPISSAYPDHCADLAQRPHDPEKAKFHLKKSGVTSVDMQVAEVDSGITDIALITQREAAKIGLNINVKKVPTDGYWGAIWMKTPVHVASWNMRPTANVMLTLAFAPDAAWNDSQWKNERMGKLLVDSRAELDPAKRKEMYCEMQRLISQESGIIIPAHRNYVDGVSDKVKGLGRLPLEALGGAEWPEFAWLDA